MPGLFGFVDRASRSSSPQESQTLLQALANAMRLEDFQQSELHSAAGLGLGCVHIPLMNPEPQPVWNEERSVGLICYGEIFEHQKLKDKLATAGVDGSAFSQSQLLLHLYLAFGDAFANLLNGTFTIAIWNGREQTLLLINDFLGAQPLYYAQYENRFAFAALANALLADPALPRKIDSVAIAEFLSWEMVLGDRTFLQDIQLMPPGSLLKVRDGEVTIERYWRLRFADEYSLRPREEYFEQFAHLLKQSIKRQAPMQKRVGVNLSGGLDSRTVLGLVTSIVSGAEIRTFTFGLKKSDDVQLAGELAQVAQTRHSTHEFDPQFLPGILAKGVRLTDGMSNCVHFHAMTVVQEQARQVDVIYSGYLGDTILSSEAPMEWIVPYDLALTRRLCEDLMGYVFVNQPMAQIFTETFAQNTMAAFNADVDAVIDRERANLTMSALNHFEVLYNGRRNTRFGNDLLRNSLLCRTPFCDKDFIEFCLTIPPGLRIGRTLIQHLIGDHFHELAKVPWDKTGFPLVECLRNYRQRVAQQARWHYARIPGLGKYKNRVPRSMHAYDKWMRAPLGSWVEGMLLTPAALQRGYVRPEVQRRLVQEHMAGKDNSRELGILISLEQWHRMFMD